ncbi:HNH endonuclease [Klebsiella pneumoniae]|uniref:HNH endonuclease signature motif containing protein n=1 Tax=Klebsiella pneumoniae TaxID=573 RepID=UPI0038D103D8
MNYKRIYDELISRGKLRGLKKSQLGFYTEKHHIHPRSLGGTDEDDNLVLLTFREHFIAHWLLTKIHPCPQMQFALNRMITSANDNVQYRLSSRHFALAKTNVIKAATKKTKELWTIDDYRNKVIKQVKKSWTKEKREERSRLMKEIWERPGYKENHAKKVSIALNKKEVKEKWKSHIQTEEQKQQWKDYQRKAPHWEFYDELYKLWLDNGMQGYYKLRKLAVSLGYPDVNYQGMFNQFKEQFYGKAA